MDRVVIKKIWTKQLFILFLALLMTLASVFCIIVDASSSRHHPYIMKLVGIVGTLFFGGGLLSLICTFNKEQMVIDSEGFIDYGANASFGFVPWSNVESISVSVYKSQKFFGVEVKDRDLLLEKLPKYKQILVRFFAKMTGIPPITISLGLVKEKPQEILDLMNEYLDEYQKNEIK